ncbi:MAG: secretin N-terminal domain-containing protein, partial [Planctomycetota bacterium]
MAAKLSYSRALGSGPISLFVAKWGSFRKAGTFVFILAATLLLCGGYVFAADSGPPRYRVFTLRHISAEQGKEYLAEVKIGTVSQLPGSNTLLITAQRRELIKASAILKLVDSKEPFVIKALFPASAVKNLPSGQQIAAEVGSILVGTFSEPPAPTASFVGSKTARAAKSKAIIDMHNDAVIAVAPAKELEKIITAIEQLQKGKTEVLRPAKLAKAVEPNQKEELKAEPALRASLLSMTGSEAELDKIAIPVSSGIGGRAGAGDSESDELFDKLLGSLAEAEKRMAESRQVETEPNEPGPVVIVPEPNEPSVGPAQTKEIDLLTAVLERLDALESAIKRGPEPQREPEPPEKEVAVKIVKPGKVVRPEPNSRGDEMLELDLPEKINIIQLLDLVSEFLGYDYMYDPGDVAGLKGEVTITMRKIKVKHLYPLLESVLKFKGFVMTRREGSNLLTVVPYAKAIDIDPPLRPEQAKTEIGDVIITRLFELKDIDTNSAQALLAGMKLGVSITPIAQAKKLIVTGYAYRMARIKELLEMIDLPGEPKQFRFRPLQYTMATVLFPKIKTLAEQLGTVSIAIGTPATAAPRSAPPPRGETAAQRRAREAREAAARAAAARSAAARAAAVGPAAAQPTVYLDADERTNRILMIGLEEQLAIVDELIDTLDVEKQDLRTLRLYEIQNVDAEEVLRKLGEIGIISGGQVTSRGPARSTSRIAPPTTKTSRITPSVTTRAATTAEALVEEPQVVIIESTNSLLVNATDEQHTQVAMIIGYVDSEQEERAIPYVVYPLENQDPEELGEVLMKLIEKTVTTQDKDAKIVKTTVRKTEEEITIIPDKNTFSIIVYASKKNQQWVKSLIEQLDKRRPQVL